VSCPCLDNDTRYSVSTRLRLSRISTNDLKKVRRRMKLDSCRSGLSEIDKGFVTALSSHGPRALMPKREVINAMIPVGHFPSYHFNQASQEPRLAPCRVSVRAGCRPGLESWLGALVTHIRPRQVGSGRKFHSARSAPDRDFCLGDAQGSGLFSTGQYSHNHWLFRSVVSRYYSIPGCSSKQSRQHVLRLPINLTKWLIRSGCKGLSNYSILRIPHIL
jgi:hypothetical protein